MRTVGRHPEMSVKEARLKALDLIRSFSQKVSAADLPAPEPVSVGPDNVVVRNQERIQQELDAIKQILKPPPVSTLTFAEVVGKLGDEIYKTKKSPSTVRTYRNYIHNVLVPYWGDMPICEIETDDILEWYHNYEGPNGGRPTQPFKIFKGVLKMAKTKTLISRLPDFSDVKSPYKPGRGEALRHRDYKRIVSYLKRKVKSDPMTQDYALLVGATTGERNFSLTSLHTDEVDFRAKEATKKRKGDKVEALPYIDEAIKLLKSIKPRGGGYFFPHQYIPGHHLSAPSLRRYFQALCRQLKITLPSGKIPVVHSLRHSFVSELGRRGIAPASIQKYVGHSDIKTTFRYLHADKELAKLEVEKVALIA